MKGNQIPRLRLEPERNSSDGKGASMLMQSYGLPLDEWQRLVLDCWLGKDEHGDYNTVAAGLSVPRQNGKNVVLEARELYGLLVNGERILHTAHQVRTAKKAFRRLANWFSDRSHPEILKAVKQIRYALGEESVELRNGGLIEFQARSRQAARGYDGISLVVFDEAQELTDEQMEALMATLSASSTGTRQLLYVGTPPYAGCAGDVFQRFRQGCIDASGKGDITRNAWHEWSIATTDLSKLDLSDRALWFETNPALGYRLTEEFTAEEYRTLSPQGFARERLGIWMPTPTSRSEKAIPTRLWDDCASDEPKPEGKTAYGVKFTADGAAVVLAGAVIDSSNKARISIIEVKPTGAGVTWLAEWLNARYKTASCVVIDGRNGADLLVDKIKDTWVFKDSVIKPSAANVVTAANLLLNELNEHTVTWYRPQDQLRDSAVTATRRSISGGWGFGGSGSELVEACSLALWGCRTNKRNPSRKMRIG